MPPHLRLALDSQRRIYVGVRPKTWTSTTADLFKTNLRRLAATDAFLPMRTALPGRSTPFAAAVVALGFRLGRKLRQRALRLPIFCQHALETAVQRLGDVGPLFDGSEQHRRGLDGGQAVLARLAA